MSNEALARVKIDALLAVQGWDTLDAGHARGGVPGHGYCCSAGSLASCAALLGGPLEYRFFRRQFDAIAKMKNGTFKINQTGVAGIRLVVRPLSEQLRFESSVQAIDSLPMQQADALTKAPAVFDAIIAQTFA